MSASPFPDLVDRLAPSVVGLPDGRAGGSGVIVAPGVAVTLARNVPGDDGDLTLATTAGPVPATVAGRDLSVDLAVVRFDADTYNLPALDWAAGDGDGDTPPLRIGTPVHAFGDPAGRGLRATTGAVAGAPRAVRGPTGRLLEGALEHTAILPRGAGGGPLVDGDGRVLGLNAVRLPGGLILAWPASALAARATALAAGRTTAPPRIGVALATPRQTQRMRAAVGLDHVDGVLVRDVADGSPAAAAGLRRGDVLVAAGGTPLTEVDALFAAVDTAASATDRALTLSVLRGADQTDIIISLDQET
ncbi:MAG TPA: S1C family serine protease [Baekduia sp.]